MVAGLRSTLKNYIIQKKHGREQVRTAAGRKSLPHKLAVKALKGIRTVSQIADENNNHPVQDTQWKQQMTESESGGKGSTALFEARADFLIGQPKAADFPRPIVSDEWWIAIYWICGADCAMVANQ